ncbi:MAG: glycosyl transferase family 2 [Microgenomates group bacterium Gr01-1014_16]|nr:MAG: glycosyl transferase family 2 [Microgenomates group bacterium Gr01-1014_16]
MTNLSVAIIAKDRALILPQCLESANKISDDVVIITNADHKFINYSDQKNYAVSKCKHDWVFSLDADEWLSPQLIEEIKNLDFSYDAYLMPRLNYIFGKPIYHSNWEPSSDTHIWLFNKNKSHWSNNVHEEVKVNGKVGKLTNYKIHQNYRTVEEFIAKMNTYTSLESKTTNPFYDFLRRYLWHKGFLDGKHGLFLSYLMMVYHTVTWVKRKLS